MKGKRYNNKGIATVETTLILPLFIFGMLALYHMIQCRITENIIYDATFETAEYIAQLGYLNEDLEYIPELYFTEYVDDEDKLERYVVGGISGIDFSGSNYSLEDNYFELEVNYTIEVRVPFMPKLNKERTITVTQRYYVGEDFSCDSEKEDGDRFVYVTDNKEVYHSTRLCTHLNLSTKIVLYEEALVDGFMPCEYCGNEKSSLVLVTDYGDKYHTNPHCSGLKRTIYRVKLREIGGVPGCTRCVN